MKLNAVSLEHADGKVTTVRHNLLRDGSYPGLTQSTISPSILALPDELRSSPVSVELARFLLLSDYKGYIQSTIAGLNFFTGLYSSFSAPVAIFEITGRPRRPAYYGACHFFYLGDSIKPWPITIPVSSPEVSSIALFDRQLPYGAVYLVSGLEVNSTGRHHFPFFEALEEFIHSDSAEVFESFLQENVRPDSPASIFVSSMSLTPTVPAA